MVKSASSPPVAVKRGKVIGGLMKSMASYGSSPRNGAGNKNDNSSGNKLQMKRAEGKSQQRSRNLKKGESVYDLDLCTFDMVADPSLDTITEPKNGWTNYGPGGGLNKLKSGGFRITDPNDENLIGRVACKFISKIPVDRRSIGGEKLYQRLQAGGAAVEHEVMATLVNEPLLTFRVMRFEIYLRGQRPHILSTANAMMLEKSNKKNRSRFRYAAIIRTTNRPLKVASKIRSNVHKLAGNNLDHEAEEKLEIEEGDLSEGMYYNDEEKEYMDEEDDVQYERMFTSDSTNEAAMHSPFPSIRKGEVRRNTLLGNSAMKASQSKSPMSNNQSIGQINRSTNVRRTQESQEVEISSFPVLVLFTMNSDGSSLEVRKIFELDQLISVECLSSPVTTTSAGASPAMNPQNSSDITYGTSSKKSNMNSGGTPSRDLISVFTSSDAGSIMLTFKNGEVVEIYCESPDLSKTLGSGGDTGAGVTATTGGDLDTGDALSSVAISLTGGTDASSSLHHIKDNKRNVPGSLPNSTLDGGDALGGQGGTDTANRREFFLWCLLQIHTMLCTSVVEHNMMQYRMQKSVTKAQQWSQQSLASTISNSPPITPLPTLSLCNIDRSELQYLCTVNGFLNKSRMVVSLLKRQRFFHPRFNKKQRATSNLGTQIGNEDLAKDEAGTSDFSLDDLAQEVLMMSGGAGSSLLLTGVYQASIFSSPEEESDAQEVINSATTQYLAQLLRTSSISATEAERQSIDMVVTGESLQLLLQKRMRQLETDACKRLIAWEDEKCNSAAAIFQSSSRRNQRDCVGFLSLVELFATLDELDADLAQMEAWLQDRSTFFRPLSNDCCEIEEENRGLEQQWKSYALLGEQLNQLLSGLEVSDKVKDVLKNPRKVLSVNRKTGAVDNEKGIEVVKGAGRDLKNALDRAVQRGGLHLRAINDCVKELLALSKTFCEELSAILSDVIRLIAADATPQIDPMKLPKGETHASMARKIRDIQRKVQSSLLIYIKLIEILSLLQPELLPKVRQVYSEVVSEGILSKRTMKAYFNLLPGHVYAVGPETATQDLKDYPSSSLKNSGSSFMGADIAPVSAEDIGLALTEMLPVIAREAYFTAALFGLSGNNLDGREKKQNFEAVKKSVDDSSVWFRYYLSRACGIAEAEGGKPTHVMLSLVASIHLNESMEGYMDRQKKGGDHSLSLAYVRATILDFRKKVDKKWVEWVEEQIKWIRSSPGVPLNGKRAGVCMSFAKFPSYLDHVMSSCRAGRSSDYVVNLAKIKVISYYLQKIAGALFANLHENAIRETTDQQYAANVMRMENSYYFLESVKKRGQEFTDLFHKQLTAATAIYKQSSDAYLGWMIKREFKALHTLFSNISRIRREVGDADVPIHVPRSIFVKTLSKECSREVMKEKIATIYLRMEKHLCPEAALFPHAWKSLVRVLYEWFGRWEKLSNHCYSYKLEPGAVEVVRIAKLAGGGLKKNVPRGEGVAPS